VSAEPAAEPRVRRAFADVPAGQIHYAEAGAGEPVLLLHQTPRSWAEYRHVLPLLGRRRRAIAMDTLGFGDSSPPPAPDSIESYAVGVLQLMDALGIERASLVGHHTGGVIAVEVAATHPERVDRLVLSCTPLVDAEGRRRRPAVDTAAPSPDGSHLSELWRGRQAFYPDGRHELLHAFVVDAIKAGPRASGGHAAVGEYEMERRLPLVHAPTLLIGAPGDLVYPDLGRLAAALPGSRVEEIPGGMVPLPDQLPEEFADRVDAFLDEAR
jgi:pimeloyl-ACP methyl ester carboxylesterase